MVTIQVNMWDSFLILKISLKHNVLFKQKVITSYCVVYNICKNKMYDKKSTK